MAATNSAQSVVDIVKKEDGQYIYKYEALREILTQKSVKNSPVAVYSVFGPSGNGKSYLLNLFSHFIRQGHTVSRNGGEASGVFENLFYSRNSVEPTTEGIRMTKKPFWIQKENQSVAVFLLDAEGSHALKQGIGDESVLFAMCNVLSSFQIINIKNTIDRNLIEEIGTFVNLQSGVQGTTASKELMFLIRDWEKSQYQYGLDGGNEYMSQLELGSMEPMQAIRKLYEEIQCFLLPHPGSGVSLKTTNNLNDIAVDAKPLFTALCNLLFRNNNLVVNTLNGEQLNGEKLLEQLNMFNFDSCLSDSTKLKNVFQVAQDEYCLKHVDASVKIYRDLVVQKVLNEEDADLAAAHDEAREAAMVHFGRLNEQQRNKFQTILEETLLEEKAEVETSLKAVKRSLQFYRDTMTKEVVKEEDGKFAAAHDKAKETAISFFEALPERQRNIFRAKLDEKLLNETMIQAKIVSNGYLTKYTKKVKKIVFSPGKVNKLYKKQGESCLDKLKVCLGDGVQFREAKSRFTKDFEQIRKKAFSEKRRNKLRLIAGATSVAGAVGGALLFLIPPVGAAVVASAVAVEVAVGGLGVLGGAIGAGVGAGVDHLATDDNKPELVEQAVVVDNKAFSVDNKDSVLVPRRVNDAWKNIVVGSLRQLYNRRNR